MESQDSAFTPVRQIGEYGLIDRLDEILGEPRDPDVVVGISDDAAVYNIGEGRVHVTTIDALIEKVHFDRAFTPMEYLGFKSISVNVSDICAMNARARYATLALAIPETVSVEMVEAFYRGVKHAADLYGVSVIGGDTTSAQRMAISVSVTGEAALDDVVFRSGAQPGDLLCVTGNVGGAYAGLKILLDQQRALQEEGESYVPDLQGYEYVIRRQLAPTARHKIIAEWAEKGFKPHALIDVSDGIASETHHLCRLSGCGAKVFATALPIDLETRSVADRFSEDVDTYALFGGEDYELLFAAAEEDLEKLDPESYAVIGEFTEKSEGVMIQSPDGELVPLTFGGYQHFHE